MGSPFDLLKMSIASEVKAAWMTEGGTIRARYRIHRGYEGRDSVMRLF